MIYTSYNFNKISSFANHYDFKNLINKLPKNLRETDVLVEKIKYEVIDKSPIISTNEIGIEVDIENTNYHFAKLYGIAISTKEKHTIFHMII